MTWNYAYSPAIWLLLLIVLLLLTLFAYSIRRRSVPGAYIFAISCLLSAIWLTGSVLELTAQEVPIKIFWDKFQVALMLPSVTAITCFILEYTWPGRWLTRRNLALACLPSLLALGLLLSSDFHRFGVHFSINDGEIIRHIGPLGWIFITYIYALGVLNFVIFAWVFIHSPILRWPVTIMLAGQIISRAAYLLQLFGVISPTDPVEEFSLSIAYLMYAIALYGFRIFDPITLARQTVIQQMQNGMIVVDQTGQIASLNPAAERIFGLKAHLAKGKLVSEILPESPNALAAVPGQVETEINLPVGEELRKFTLTASLLSDWRGLAAGRLLMLRDVTDQKRASELVQQKQHLLDIVHERERLARELHDSQGQVFAFVNVQGQTIRNLLSQGDIPTALIYLDHLVNVARDADVDIREAILGLRLTLSEQGFFPMLAQYLAHFEKNCGIQVKLDKPVCFTDQVFEPLVHVQLMRILQEALTNVRKHAEAHSVHVGFAAEDGKACVTIQDDGRGFNTCGQVSGLEEHIGLRVMFERAQEVGGSLSLDSQPGRGTKVVIRVPIKKDMLHVQRGDV